MTNMLHNCILESRSTLVIGSRYGLPRCTHMGDTRYGRKAEGGQLSGRDPALLPSCVETLPTFSPGTAIAKAKERVDAENLP